MPANPETIFVLESPPASGLYFYNPAGLVSEPLFLAMMKDVLALRPATKHERLQEFSSRGYLLVDATYSPVNQLKGPERNDVIRRDIPLLIEELRKFTGPDASLVLVKMNVCDLLEPVLVASGFRVLNGGARVPFPSHGNQKKFRVAMRGVLGMEGS